MVKVEPEDPNFFAGDLSNFFIGDIEGELRERDMERDAGDAGENIAIC
jgi:hypothetical protein